MSKKIKSLFNLPVHSADGVRFFQFPAISNISAYKRQFRSSLDDMELSASEQGIPVDRREAYVLRRYR